ncbi:transmembrane protein 184C [Anthonomus grandis grandis]|uniref:transmembrane protein 184C n=1 Tax=Anthonomus grandis grandis TaxID=2921223 RepID=UPI0021666EBE|nr:transmembrane protein 184C [Anthonomus grandis grandis]
MCFEQCAECFPRWKLWIRPLFIAVYAIAALVFVPVFLLKSLKDGFNRHDLEVLIAAVFVGAAIPISLWEIIQHVIHYTQPRLQKFIIRILWMVPIYAINAWLGLTYPDASVYVDSARECYEAYVIYNFLQFLLNYLNMEMDLEANLECKPQVKHTFPMCCLPNWEMGRPFVHICKHGILQYTVMRPLTTAISVICKILQVYGDGQFKPSVAFPYLIVINNISQSIAMYCLIMFYRACKYELKPMEPLPKFLCIKAVVFFSFFQGVLIAFFVYTGAISSTEPDVDGVSLSTRLQDFLICIEMCLAAIAHHYSFSYKPYVKPGTRPQSCCSSFLAMWDISDVGRDVQEHLSIVTSSISRTIRGRSTYSIPRGSDEYQNLMSPREGHNLPADFYQGQDEVVVNYGTYGSLSSSTPSSNTPVRTHSVGTSMRPV